MEFKKLSAVEAVETVGDAAHVLIEEDGVIKRAPKDEVGSIKVASAAEVGQTIVVKAVDGNGVPTEWECVDMGGSCNAGYDAIVRYNTSGWDNPELIFGSYDALIAKIKVGEWVNILVYAAEPPYNMVIGKVTAIFGDWDESYYVRITFTTEDDTSKTCFIYINNSVS